MNYKYDIYRYSTTDGVAADFFRFRNCDIFSFLLVVVASGYLQANREKELNRYMFSQREDNIPMTSAEKLYRMILPNLSQYIIALLKVLLAAAPSSKVEF